MKIIKNKKQIEIKKYMFILMTIITWSIMVNISFGYALRPAYTLALVGIILLLNNTSTLCAKVMIISSTLIATIYYPIADKYGPPNINSIAALRYTSVSESMEFLSKIHSTTFAACFFIILLSLVCISSLPNITILSKNNYRVLAIAILITIGFKPTLAYIHKGRIQISDIKFTPFRFAYDIYVPTKIINMQEKLTQENQKKPESWNPSIHNKNYNTYIIVIGESVRSDYMENYGFKIDNTPFMSSSNGVFFKNYISSSFATVPSLTHSLYLRENGKLEYNNSIIRLAKKSGFQTYWLSNQGRFGLHDGPVAEIGKEADHPFFIKKGDSDDHKSFPDTALLPSISESLKKDGDKLIVIHLIGSHPDACVRANNMYDVYYVSKDISCYIQSIKNTDALLKEITILAEKNKQKWSMLYFSDHGLSHFNKNSSDVYLEHDDKYKQNFQVPFFITSYDSKNRISIESYRSGLNFLSIFSQWTGINEPKLKSSCDYFSEQNCHAEINVLDSNFKIRPYASLKEDPLT